MGHLSHHKSYRDLRTRIDKCHTRFPETEESMEILRMMFTPEEAELVARMPFIPQSARSIARRVGKDEAFITRMLERMADKGLIFDLYMEKKDRSYYMVAPPVVGFFEFSLMRRRKDIDQPGLSQAFEDVMAGPENFIKELLDWDTTIGRTLVHETTLDPDDAAEILPYERASAAVEDADLISVSLCYCRHKAEHLGHPCKHSMDNCLSMGVGASSAIRRQGARPIDSAEALEILDRSREAGLVYIADNVKRKVTYICSCCSCCCGQLTAISRYGVDNAVKTSAFIAEIDSHKCTGCGRCARQCPIQAIQIQTLPPHVQRKARMYSTVDRSVCLGCGVCQPVCRKGALSIKARPERVLTPEGTLERVLSMALERDRLQHQLFDDEGGLHLLMLNRLAGAILRLPPVKQALMRDQLKSRFVGFLASSARRTIKSATTV